MREELELRQEYARKLVDIEDASATYGFLREYGEECVEKVEEIAESDLRSEVRSDSYEETAVFKLMEKVGILDNISGDYYSIEVDPDELDIFRDQLEEDLDDEYGKHELIAYLQVHGERLNDASEKDRKPTVDYLRSLDIPPTEKPYKDNFGSMTYALRVAGFEPKEELDKKFLEEELRRAIFRKNRENDELIETLSAREIQEDESLHSACAYQNIFGSIENAYEDALLSEVRGIEEDMERWQEIVGQFPRAEEIDRDNLRAVYPAETL